MLPVTLLLPVLITVPALSMVSTWQQPFQIRLVVLFPTVSVPPATVLSLADPPWSLRMSTGSRFTLPAARSSRLLVRVTVPLTLPVLPDATTVTPLAPITPPLQVASQCPLTVTATALDELPLKLVSPL